MSEPCQEQPDKIVCMH